MEILVLVSILLLFIGVATAAILFNLRLHAKITEQYQQLSQKYELELTMPPTAFGGLMRRNPTLYGTYRNREISIYSHGYGLDDTRQTDTAIRIKTNALPELRFTLGSKSTAGKITEIRSLKSSPVGDSAFDKKLSIRSNDPEKIKILLNSENRALLLENWNFESGYLTLNKNTLTYIEFGLPDTTSKRERIEALVEHYYTLLDAMQL